MNLDLLEVPHKLVQQVTDPGLAYMVVGGFVVALYINEVVLGTACGIIFGPYCANIFNPRSWGGDINVITLEVMRVTLAAGLFAIGVELPQSYLAEHVKGLLIMVVPTMAFGWLVVAAVIFVVFPPLNFISSLVIAACLTPTDPIISAAIVGGKYATKHVPLNLRRILSAESAANDGLAYPFLSVSIYLTTETSRRVAIGEWFLVGWLYQVILGTVIGAVLGIAFSHLMKFSHRKGFIDRESYVAQYLALALFTVGITRTLGSDDLLAAFAAGSAISWDGYFNQQIEDEVFSSVIDLLLNCGCFVYIGAWMPFNMFNAPELGITPWRLVVLFVAVLVLRRIPPLLLLYKWVPEIKTWREAIFSGHFGPMGVGAIFVSTLAVTELPTPQSPPKNQAEILSATLQTIVSFVVLGSIIIHGLSIPFFSLGRNVRTRTLSLTYTWTSRNATHSPEWLLWARRTPGGTQPGTVIDESRDVERGSDRKVEPIGRTEPLAIPQGEAANAVNVDFQLPEMSPAAMIGDAAAAAEGPSTHFEVACTHEIRETPANADKLDLKSGLVATGTDGEITQTASQTQVVDVRVFDSPHGLSALELSADGKEDAVRFPLTPSDDVGDNDDAPGEMQSSTSGKTVRFPADVVPDEEGVSGGGDATLGKNLRFLASQ
ncbi:Sodium/hydrogen exchanger family-domain-containing protein [Trametes meyenii]|nr:Sodium/hydrogen exchanger family-domain-containing protein [Trametes meyenii]